MTQELQLGLQIESESQSNRQPKRTKSGDLRATDLKAIQWYTINNGYKPAATSAVPHIHFTTQSGEDVTVHLGDILDEYDEFKRATHGKRQAAA